MKIIVGLGNPGPKYETTRHNLGFLALDRLVDKLNATGPAKKNEAEVYQASFAGESLLLVKPQTYMNLSGKSVAPLFNFYRCEPGDLIVLHDDLDLKPFALRIKTGGGTGGHNGLKSIDECLGKEKTGYHRVRLGIGNPAMLESRIATVDYVLQQFSDEELKALDGFLDEVAEATEMVIRGNIAAAMNKFHKR